MIVAGGIDDFSYNYDHLSSTEILKPGDSSWTSLTELPSKMSGIKSLYLGNTIYLTGMSL